MDGLAYLRPGGNPTASRVVSRLAVLRSRSFGYSVLEAFSPLQALAMLDEGAAVALLFTDVVMPDMSGRQLADLAREKHPDIKVLYTTGYTRDAIVHNGMLDPGTSLLAKPFSIDDLAVKIRKILDD
jgi:CheY-like chemotaxis protein